MKKLLAISFLVILSLPALYKVGFFSYFMLNRSFITENYCVNRDKPITVCYGQCFLNKGLLLVDYTANPDKLVIQLKAEMPASLPDQCGINLNHQLEVALHYIPDSPKPLKSTPPLVFRPPLNLV